MQSKVGLAGHIKPHHPDVDRKNLTDSSFIVKQSKQLKEQQTNLIKSFTDELTFRGTYNKEIMRLSLRVKFVDYDMTRQRKDLET